MTPVQHANGQPRPRNILVLDIGGTNVKFLASGQTEPRRFPSGKTLTPRQMVEQVLAQTGDWAYDAVSIGCPGPVGDHGPRSEPLNLGGGWVGFDFAAAFGKPVRILNDAALQALGCYEGGRMLFLGLGTGLGSTLVSDNVIVPLELGELPNAEGRPIWHDLGRRGRKRLGNKAWRRAVCRTVRFCAAAFLADYVMLGGGNVKHLKRLPPGARRGHNSAAFRGGFRLWNLDDVRTLTADAHPVGPVTPPSAPWRLI